MVLKMVHLWLLYPVRFEGSGENRRGGALPDHVEKKNFDP